MDRRKLIYLVLSIVVLAALMVFLLKSDGVSTPISKGSANNPEPGYASSKWGGKPRLRNKDPYGLYVFEELLINSRKFNGFNEIYDYTLMDSILLLDDQLFMFVGDHFAITETESNALFQSISGGNELFISANRFSDHFLNHLFNRSTLSFYAADSVFFKTSTDDYSMYFIYEQDTLSALWKVLPATPQKSKVLSSIQTKANYVAYPYGQGTIYFHTNVLAFQNFQLLRAQGKDYMKEVIEPLSASTIQWLAYADFEPYDYSLDEPTGETNSLLSRIFDYASLRWAFFTLVIGLALFFLFRSKRERPVIPIYKETTNAGMTYVDTIAGLYFAQNNPNRMRKLLLRNFYTAVQEHFFIDLSKRLSDKTLSVLAEKSKVDINKVTILVRALESTEKSNKQALFSLHQQLRDFYIISGIWNLYKQPKFDKYVAVYRPTMPGLAAVTYGIIALAKSFVLLAYAMGVGIIFWPIGIFCILVGARILSRPIYSINSTTFVYSPLFGKRQQIKRDEIQKVVLESNELTIVRKQGAPMPIRLNQVQRKQKENLLDLVYSFNRN